jgi:hypothetical protein
MIAVPAWCQTIQEVRIRWNTATASPPDAPAAQRSSQPGSHFFSLVDRQVTSGRLPRQREPEVNFDKLVIVARADDEEIIAWQVIPDPRVIRAESPGPGGELTGRLLYRDRADFLFTLPDDSRIARLEFYQPRWTGAGFDLDRIGGVDLR